tara:strand:- start:51335 stop:51445 length:111 start_codon:yes stop_codon:yes gene_type:complete
MYCLMVPTTAAVLPIHKVPHTQMVLIVPVVVTTPSN